LRLVLNKFPIVIVENTIQSIKANNVFCDAEKGGAMMAEYLLNKGAQKIGFMTYPSQFTFGVKIRNFGFQSALVTNGIQPLSEEKTLTVKPDVLKLPKGEVPHEIIEFLKKDTGLEAIAVVDSHLAKFLCQACSK